MGLDDMKKKASDAMSGDKGEQRSDDALDRGEDFAGKRTGGKYDDKISSGRDTLDERVGPEGAQGAEGGSGDQNR